MPAVPATWRIKLIAQRLQAGAVIAYPTEGVWGLGCLPEFPQAVARILDLKQRSWEQGLILVAGDIGEIAPYLTGIDRAARAELARTWPAPVTFLVPDNGIAPTWIRGRHDTVALRVSPHPVIKAICAAVKGPIVSTSANPARRRPAVSRLQVHQYFSDEIDYIVPGTLGDAGAPSEIRELGTGVIHRPARARQ
ncbi:MAG: Sua5/YciO/YrdC/YwlC family protein [Pseudomonadales bacterium]